MSSWDNSQQIQETEAENTQQILETEADGHCLLHAVCLSTAHQPTSPVTVGYQELLDKLFNEAETNKFIYMGMLVEKFYVDMTEEMYDSQLSLYICDKKYDLDIGDVMPYIIANTLQIDIIIDLEAKTQMEIPVTLFTKMGHIKILKQFYPVEHYSGLRCAGWLM